MMLWKGVFEAPLDRRPQTRSFKRIEPWVLSPAESSSHTCSTSSNPPHGKTLTSSAEYATTSRTAVRICASQPAEAARSGSVKLVAAIPDGRGVAAPQSEAATGRHCALLGGVLVVSHETKEAKPTTGPGGFIRSVDPPHGQEQLARSLGEGARSGVKGGCARKAR
jgi:hypothetical protein